MFGVSNHLCTTVPADSTATVVGMHNMEKVIFSFLSLSLFIFFQGTRHLKECAVQSLHWVTLRMCVFVNDRYQPAAVTYWTNCSGPIKTALAVLRTQVKGLFYCKCSGWYFHQFQWVWQPREVLDEGASGGIQRNPNKDLTSPTMQGSFSLSAITVVKSCGSILSPSPR